MDLKEQFEKAIAESKTLSEKPSNDTLLQLYSLYKQASEEISISTRRPILLILWPKQSMKPGRP